MPSWWWLLVQLLMWCCAGALMVLWWLWLTSPHVDAPGPPTFPIIGNVLDLFESPLTTRKLRGFHRQYGDLIRFYVGPKLLIVVAHPDDVQHILLTSKLVDRDPYTTTVMRTFLGNGLLTLNGSRWKVHRKIINPTFHSELLEDFLQAFHKEGLFLSERLARSRGQPTTVYPMALFAALRSFCNTAIGVDPDLVIPESITEEEFANTIREAMATMQRMICRPWLQSKFIFWLTSPGCGLFKYVQMMKEWAMRCIAIRSASTEQGPAKTRLRLLDALVKPGGETVMPLSEVRDELVNTAIAGIETTSVTMSYVLALLSLHSSWQDAAHQELTEIFGEDDHCLQAASVADLNGLRVLESIIKETLRLFPSVPVLPRKAVEDLRLAGGRVLVPKGTLLAVSPYLTHRLPQFFPDPERFDPSRFLDGRGDGEHPGCYLPFGLGPRSCVGSQFARLEIKVVLAHVLRRFRILPHSTREDLDENTISLSSNTIQPIKVSFVPRQMHNNLDQL